MKRIYFVILKSKVYKRFRSIEKRQKIRTNCILEAKAELRKWSDIPCTWQTDTISRIVKVPEGRWLTKEMMWNLITPQYTVDELAKMLPLSWY